jgi:2-polyprenyl-3-methyl-5-hydroxy-6-metoxy-1,4-benzoquinol methylase
MKNLIKNTFYLISKIAVKRAIQQDQVLNEVWNLSLKVLPDLGNHYAIVKLSDEAELRVRMLTCAQVAFLKRVVVKLSASNRKKTYLDVGDSDGSVRLLFENKYPELSLKSMGINLQKKAVDNIKKQGLDAECIDAMDLYKQGRVYDIVSVFETLEHLSNPIGFLQSIRPVVKERLIISVPLIVNSRISLAYLNRKWPKLQMPTIANNHIFELSPKDLTKIFWHTGWEVEDQWEVRTFPKHGPLGWLMKYAWRKISFEGWYFVSLLKNDKFASQYMIE